MSKLKKGTVFTYKGTRQFVAQSYRGDDLLATSRAQSWQVFKFTAEQQKLIKVVS